MFGRISFAETFVSDLILDNTVFHMLAEHDRIIPNTETIRLLNTPHTHSYCELFACGNGTMQLSVNGSIITLQDGDAALIPPLVPHCILTCESADWGSVSFSFTRLSGSDAQDLFSILSPLSARDEACILRGVPELYDCMCALNTLIGQHRHRTASVRFSEMVILTAELYADQSTSDQYAKKSAPTKDDDAVTRLNTLNSIINTNFMNRLTVTEIAGQLHISERHLSRIIRRQYGTTLNGLLNEKRLSAAGMLLETSDHPLALIAATVGFGSTAGFYREFTRKYGISPAKYRRQKRTRS